MPADDAPLTGDCVECCVSRSRRIRPGHAKKPGTLAAQHPNCRRNLSPMRMGLRRVVLVAGSLLAAPFLIALAGCGTATVTANTVNAAFAISPGAAALDTNCTGCNATDAHGLPVHAFVRRSANGSRRAGELVGFGRRRDGGAGPDQRGGRVHPSQLPDCGPRTGGGDGAAGRRSADCGQRPDHRDARIPAAVDARRTWPWARTER